MPSANSNANTHTHRARGDADVFISGSKTFVLPNQVSFTLMTWHRNPTGVVVVVAGLNDNKRIPEVTSLCHIVTRRVRNYKTSTRDTSNQHVPR